MDRTLGGAPARLRASSTKLWDVGYRIKCHTCRVVNENNYQGLSQGQHLFADDSQHHAVVSASSCLPKTGLTSDSLVRSRQRFPEFCRSGWLKTPCMHDSVDQCIYLDGLSREPLFLKSIRELTVTRLSGTPLHPTWTTSDLFFFYLRAVLKTKIWLSVTDRTHSSRPSKFSEIIG